MRVSSWPYVFLGGLLFVAVLSGMLTSGKPEREIGSTPKTDPTTVSMAVDDTAADGLAYLDLRERAYLPPLSVSPSGRHWLGTDRLGRDVLTGLISGTRIAVLVGFGSLLVACLIGMPLGALAGFFGNSGFRLSVATVIAGASGLILGTVYAFSSLVPAVESGLVLSLAWLLTTVGLTVALHLLLLPLKTYWPVLRRRVGLPVDGIVLLVLELFGSLPGLVVLITILAYVEGTSIWLITLIIGLLGWTSIARFLRAELLRIRELPYIDAARMGGTGAWRLLIRHALPNTLGPLVVVGAFLVGANILAEAALSFLGIGVPTDQVTWGSMLQQSRNRPEAWWLALFPGLLLTLTVLACNSLRRTA